MRTGVYLDTTIQIDHINVDGSDNSNDNLRLSNHCTNQHNTLKRKDNTSGYKGLYWNKTSGVFFGKVQLDGSRYCSKRSRVKEEAILSLEKLRQKLHKEFTNHG